MCWVLDVSGLKGGSALRLRIRCHVMPEDADCQSLGYCEILHGFNKIIVLALLAAFVLTCGADGGFS